jgi:hypothetical protein
LKKEKNKNKKMTLNWKTKQNTRRESKMYYSKNNSQVLYTILSIVVQIFSVKIVISAVNLVSDSSVAILLHQVLTVRILIK